LINTNALLNGVVPHSRENKMSYFYIRGFPWRLFSFKISDNIKALLSVFKYNPEVKKNKVMWHQQI
jgi:hypothetical protein